MKHSMRVTLMLVVGVVNLTILCLRTLLVGLAMVTCLVGLAWLILAAFAGSR